MDEIEKLLRKRKRKDRERLLAALQALKRGDHEGLQVKKLAGSRFYRVRVGDFRIIFSIGGKDQGVIVESVRIRNEKTYE